MKKYFSQPYVTYLVLLSFSINVGFSFQLFYLTSIFKLFGATSGQLSFLWLAPPITGLFVQPIMGQLSDASSTRYGKRLPYLMGSGIVTALSCILIPYVDRLLYAVLLIWVLNAGFNGCMAMWRALINDLTAPEERSKAFAFYGFWGGVGSACGTVLPYLIDKIDFLRNASGFLESTKLTMNLFATFVFSGVLVSLAVFIFVLKVRESATGPSQKAERSSSLFQIFKKVFIGLVKDLKESSAVFKKICVLNSAAYFGIFAFWIYFIMVLVQNFYSGPRGLSEEQLATQFISVIQKATSDSAAYLSISQVVTLFYSLFLFFLLERTKKVILIHAISLIIGAAGMFLVGAAHHSALMLTAMVAVGILTGSCNILPYVVVSWIVPQGKAGLYFGLFNIGITLSQIIGALTLSPIYRYLLFGNASYILFLAGVVISVSAALWLRETASKIAPMNESRAPTNL